MVAERIRYKTGTMTKLPDLVSEKESQKWKENVIVKLVNICFLSKTLDILH